MDRIACLQLDEVDQMVAIGWIRAHACKIIPGRSYHMVTIGWVGSVG